MRDGITVPCHGFACVSNMRLPASSVRAVSRTRYAIRTLTVPMVSWKPPPAYTICGFDIANAVYGNESKTLFLITSTIPSRPRGDQQHCQSCRRAARESYARFSRFARRGDGTRRWLRVRCRLQIQFDARMARAGTAGNTRTHHTRRRHIPDRIPTGARHAHRRHDAVSKPR